MRRILVLALAMSVLGGCQKLERHTLVPPAQLPSTGEALHYGLYQAVGVELTPGHSVQIYENGDVFDGIVDDLAKAERSIHIVLYIWRKSAPSDRVVAAITERARHGVTCRVMVDPVGSRKFDEEVRPDLEKAGCDVRTFDPAGSNTTRAFSRNHRKMVIVDGRVAYTGGFGLWKSWEGHGLAHDQWRDTAVRVEGPAVRDMQRNFAENWLQVGGQLLDAEEFESAERVAQNVSAAEIGSGGSDGLTNAERAYMYLVNAAHDRLWIANSYFVPSPPMVKQLRAKARAGVDVRILCPGDEHDLPPILAGQRAVYDDLLRDGVKIYEYQPAMMHAKTIVMDDHLVSVGSINFDPLSLKKLEEDTILVDDRALARQAAEMFERDLQHARPITLQSREGKGVGASVAYRLLWWGSKLL